MEIALRQQQKSLDGIRHTGMILAGIHCLERYSARNFLFADRWILASTIARLYLLSRPTAYFHVNVLGNRSSTIAPALIYYPPSMAVCVTLIPFIHEHMHCSTTYHPWQYSPE